MLMKLPQSQDVISHSVSHDHFQASEPLKEEKRKKKSSCTSLLKNNEATLYTFAVKYEHYQEFRASHPCLK